MREKKEKEIEYERQKEREGGRKGEREEIKCGRERKRDRQTDRGDGQTKIGLIQFVEAGCYDIILRLQQLV